MASSTYSLGKKIDKGDFASIYTINRDENIDFQSSRYLAKIERLRIGSITQNEAEIHSRLSHPNIVKFFESFLTEKLNCLIPSSSFPNYQVIIMERFGCENLLDFIESREYPSLDTIKNYASQLTEALIYLKKMNIIHRDLKPENVLISEQSLKICDFGLSCIGPQIGHASTGTPYYMPPESFKCIYNFKTDIYSFGVILYQLCSKRMPFPAQNVPGLVQLVEFNHFTFPSDTCASPEMQDLIRKMLKAKGEERIGIEDVSKHMSAFGN
jgi:serine/threonine protein kinase